MYKIEKGFSLENTVPRGRKPVYPFKDMEVGDSFLIEKSLFKAVSLASLRFVRRKQPEWKFSIATHKDGTIRCHRIK